MTIFEEAGPDELCQGQAAIAALKTRCTRILREEFCRYPKQKLRTPVIMRTIKRRIVGAFTAEVVAEIEKALRIKFSAPINDVQLRDVVHDKERTIKQNNTSSVELWC